MTSLRLAYVGVGRWARKLNGAFTGLGHRAVAHVRKTASMPFSATGAVPRLDGFGIHYGDWRPLIEDKSVDALVLCATPEVVTEAALACAAAGKPCLATKPLMLETPPAISAPLYVDFWRLWSEGWQRFREEYAVGTYPLAIDFFGGGPVRTFPGSLDYGPHVVAFLHEMCIREWRAAAFLPAQQGELLLATGEHEGRYWSARFGNGATSGERKLVSGIALVEDPDFIRCNGGVPERKDLVLQAFCRSFASDVLEGFANDRLLRLSCDGMQELRKMRELAGKVSAN